MFNVRRRQLILELLLATAWPVFAAEAPPLQTSLTPVRPRLVAPDFELKNLDGKSVSLSGLRGKVVLVNFWATWCPPCRREFASMQKLDEIMAGEPLQILAVNEGESVDAIESFVSTLDKFPDFSILLDDQGDAMGWWPVHGLPTSFVIDKRGRIAYRAIGGREFDDPRMAKRIKALLLEKTGPIRDSKDMRRTK
jgi:thiol-disulfide isomerase/thioredoxin